MGEVGDGGFCQPASRTLELARWLEINITVAVGILERLDMGEVGDGGFC